MTIPTKDIFEKLTANQKEEIMAMLIAVYKIQFVDPVYWGSDWNKVPTLLQDEIRAMLRMQGYDVPQTIFLS